MGELGWVTRAAIARYPIANITTATTTMPKRICEVPNFIPAHYNGRVGSEKAKRTDNA